MTAQKPPVPPEQRSPHEAGDEAGASLKPSVPSSKRGQQENLEQNTTNKGLQQDR
jgi:hypothetical protein